MVADDAIRQIVVDKVNEVLSDTGRSPLATVNDTDRLMDDIGLDSLDLAVLVVNMEKAVGHDHFREGGRSAQTLADFVSLYKNLPA